jgi:ADP-ribose pyrophosphatase YjhB (NUDIX family)
VGESLEVAIKREVLEETALTVEVLGITAVLDRIYQDPDGQVAYHYVLIDFACEYLAGELRPASDITAAQFVKLDDLPNIPLPPFTAQVINRAWGQKESGNLLPVIF